MASTDLTRTFAIGTADERKKHTFSAWIKLSHIGSTSNTFFANRPSGNYRFYYMIANSGAGGIANKFYCYMVYNGSAMLEATGSRVLRDVNGWYHIVVRTDTTQGSGSDRFRVYINGEQETLTFGHTPDQDEELQVNRDAVHNIGEEGNGNGQFDGYMSHIHFCDGYSYGPESFGSTDATTGEWKINVNPSVSYGTNGFFILKDGNSVTDQSGQGNNWTVAAGSLTNTEDCPDNVFCTMNPLRRFGGNLATSQGNNTLTETAASWQMCSGTLGANKGKYYYEYKITTLGGGNGYHKIGITSDLAGNDDGCSHSADTELDGGYVFYCQNGTLEARTDQAVISGWSGGDTNITFSNNDVMCIAVDMDNKFIYFRKNGDAWAKSGDPTSGATGTGGINISSDYPSDNSKFAIPTIAVYSNGAGSVNFGNGYFGTTAISSEGTNASNLGKFEFDVPTGYTALCTKGLNE